MEDAQYPRLPARGDESTNHIPAVAVSGLSDLDTAEFASELAEFNLTQQQQQEFLYTIWQLMAACVEMNLNIGNVCGQLALSADPVLSNGAVSLDSGDTP